MNKFIELLKEEWKEKPTSHKLIAIFGGIDTLFYIVTPLILVILWTSITKVENLNSWVFYIIGFLASTFRAYKIGWLQK